MSSSETRAGEGGGFWLKSAADPSKVEKIARHILDLAIPNKTKGIVRRLEARGKIDVFEVGLLNDFYRYAARYTQRVDNNSTRPKLEERIKTGRQDAARQIRAARRGPRT